MTYDEAANDMMRFTDYLHANGKRAIAISMHITDDSDNTDKVITWGNSEQVMEMSVVNLAGLIGLKVHL